jgi:hypothetical protein
MNKLTHKERLQHEADRYMRLVNVGLDMNPVDEQMRESFRVVTKWNLKQHYKFKDLVENYDKHFQK